MDAILRSEPTPLAITAPNLDPRIIRIVEKALEKDPDRRYQDLSQMRRDVDRIKMELALAEPGAQSTVGGLRLNKSAQLEELVRRRTQQIAANLENAERAFELGDYGAALAACEDALIIDPQDNRALEGLQRAQAALVERQALAHLNMARQHFAKDELTLAEGALNAAFELVPSLREGLDLQQLLGSARQQKEQRSRSLKLALDRARIRLGEGAFESALNAADEALNYDPLDSQAQRLKQEAIVGLDAERLQREADRQVKVAIDEAMRLAGRDRYGDALQLLSDPAIAAHPLARDARARIESAHSEFERLKAAAAARIAAARKDTGGAPKADEDDDRETVGPTPSPVAMSTPAPVAPRSIVPAPVVPPPVVDPTFVGVAPPAPVAPPVRRPEPPPGELTFVEPLDRTRPFAAPPRLSLLGEYDSPGFLPGPVRPRKPKPPRRPVVFLDKEADRGGAREWFHDQLFVTGKQGHDSFGFGVSVTTHVVLGAMIAVVLIARPDITILPPDKTPLMMVTATVPRPPVVDTTPPKPTERPTPKKDIAQNPQMTQPVTSAPPPPNPAPVDAPPDITPSNSPSAIANLAPVEPPKPVLVAPLSAGGIDGIVSEVPVTDFDQAAAIVNIVKPKVPVGASGKINVEVTVLSNGRVSRVKVLTQTPYTALVSDAASQCTFRPARRRGKPVTTTVVIQYDLDTNK
jgi:tetratricopeptide (TPR) repeat protein